MIPAAPRLSPGSSWRGGFDRPRRCHLARCAVRPNTRSTSPDTKSSARSPEPRTSVMTSAVTDVVDSRMMRGKSTPSITVSASPMRSMSTPDIPGNGVDVDVVAHDRGEVKFGQHQVDDLNGNIGDGVPQRREAPADDILAPLGQCSHPAVDYSAEDRDSHGGAVGRRCDSAAPSTATAPTPTAVVTTGLQQTVRRSTPTHRRRPTRKSTRPGLLGGSMAFNRQKTRPYGSPTYDQATFSRLSMI